MQSVRSYTTPKHLYCHFTTANQLSRLGVVQSATLGDQHLEEWYLDHAKVGLPARVTY
jgi:hypothetical protein